MHFYTQWNIRREIKETVQFTIPLKRTKYLGINLPKEVKDLYLLIESINKTLLKEIEDDQKDGKK